MRQSLTPLDWRIIAALIRSRAVWYVPRLDMTRAEGTIARALVFADPAETPGGLLRELGKLPGVLSIEDTRNVSPHNVLDLFVHLVSAADVEEIERMVLSLQGVQGVETVFPRTGQVFVSWADERLVEKLPPKGTPRTGLTPRSSP